MSYHTFKLAVLLSLLISYGKTQEMGSPNNPAPVDSGSSRSFVQLTNMLEQQALNAVSESDDLQSSLESLIDAIGEFIATYMQQSLAAVQNADTIAMQITQGINAALEIAVESLATLSELNVESIGNEIDGTVIGILSEYEDRPARIMVNEVILQVVDILNQEFLGVTDETFKEHFVDVASLTRGVGRVTTTTTTSVGIEGIKTQIIDEMQPGKEPNYNQMAQLVVTLLIEGGTTQFLDILTELGEKGLTRESAVQLLIACFQNTNFPSWIFAMDILGAISPSDQTLVTLLADAIAGSQQEAPQLNKVFAFAIQSQRSIEVLDKVLQTIAKEEKGCQILRNPLLNAQEYYNTSSLLDKLNMNATINDCSKKGVEFKILGPLSDPLIIAKTIQNATYESEVYEIANTLLLGLSDPLKRVENLQPTIYYIFRNWDVDMNIFTKAISVFCMLGGDGAKAVLGDLFIDFTSFKTARALRSHFIELLSYVYFKGTSDVVTSFTQVLKSVIDNESECAFKEVLEEAAEILTGKERVNYLKNIQAFPILNTCVNGIVQS